MILTLEGVGEVYSLLADRIGGLKDAHKSALARTAKRAVPQDLSRTEVNRRLRELERQGLSVSQALTEINESQEQLRRENTPESPCPAGVIREMIFEVMGIKVSNRGVLNRFIARILLNAWKVRSSARTDPKGILVQID